MNTEFIKWLEDQVSLCSLAITACGTDENAIYVYKLYRKRFRNKIEELTNNKDNGKI